MTSKTPRTDADLYVLYTDDDEYAECCHPFFARQLENELTALNEFRIRVINYLNQHDKQPQELQDALDDLSLNPCWHRSVNY